LTLLVMVGHNQKALAAVIAAGQALPPPI